MKTLQFFSWISASIFVALPFFARYNYVCIYSWEVALDSYTVPVFVIISVVTTQFLFNKRLFKVLATPALANWIIFLVVAYHSGAKMSLVSVINGQSVHDSLRKENIPVMPMDL